MHLLYNNYLNFSTVCNNSGGQTFSLTAVGLIFPCESPLSFEDTSNPPSPLFVVLVVVVVVPVTNFDPNKLPLPNSDAVNTKH